MLFTAGSFAHLKLRKKIKLDSEQKEQEKGNSFISCSFII